MDWTDRIGRRIRLRDLHIVLAVAERGSMAKAATHLAISHPVVSKTISELEHTLGVRLFDRSSQGVELTTYGQAMHKCGVTVFDEMRQGSAPARIPGCPRFGGIARRLLGDHDGRRAARDRGGLLATVSGRTTACGACTLPRCSNSRNCASAPSTY